MFLVRTENECIDRQEQVKLLKITTVFNYFLYAFEIFITKMTLFN